MALHSIRTYSLRSIESKQTVESAAVPSRYLFTASFYMVKHENRCTLYETAVPCISNAKPTVDP